MLKPSISKLLYFCNSWILISAPVPHLSHEYSNMVTDATLSGKLSATDKNTFSDASGQKILHAPKPSLNKSEARFVKAYIRNSADNLRSIQNRSKIPFEIIDSVFNHYKLPVQLRYLAVVESELKSSATSRVGAKGPWQLMPGTARDLGLKVNRQCDERTDYFMSTRAAALYLKDLYTEFGDWLLVMAAYNGGPAPVLKAIKSSGTRNFWSMQQYLPAESRGEVKRFIATHYYFEGHGSVTTLTKSERIQYLSTVKKFELARPGINASAARTARKSKTSDTRAYFASANNSKLYADAYNPFYSPALAGESENEKFNRIMVNAESAILTSSSIVDR